MILITLLILLLTESFAWRAPYWQAEYYYGHYLNYVANDWLDSRDLGLLTMFVIVLLPSIIVGSVLAVLDSDLIEFIVGLLILAVCMGYEKKRLQYKHYIQALLRKDIEAQSYILDELSQPEPVNTNEPETEIRQTLIWLNFKYYVAPVFYFVVLGATGLLVYISLLYIIEMSKNNNSATGNNKFAPFIGTLAQCLELAYWLPSRCMSLGFMLVGHFSEGLGAWLKHCVDSKYSAKQVYVEIALSAESRVPDYQHEQVLQTVKLIKRNNMLFIVFVALLTLYGLV